MRKLLKSFGFALTGIAKTVREERNFRIHLVAAVFVIALAVSYYRFSAAEYAVLALTIGAVLAAELFNTAVESLADLVTREENALVKKAKDAAAGGVLVCALASVGVFVVLFMREDAWRRIADSFTGDPWLAVVWGAGALVGVLFVFCGGKR